MSQHEQHNTIDRRMKSKLFQGYVLIIIGLAMIVISSVNYLFGWKLGMPPAAMGIIFTAVGAARIRKAKKEIQDSGNPQD